MVEQKEEEYDAYETICNQSEIAKLMQEHNIKELINNHHYDGWLFRNDYLPSWLNPQREQL